jgi:hypothetical protein
MIGSENENEPALDNVAGIRKRTQTAGGRGAAIGSAGRLRHRLRPTPPGPPFARGGKARGVAFGCAGRFDRISGSAATSLAPHPPGPPFARVGKVGGVAFGCARGFGRITGMCGFSPPPPPPGGGNSPTEEGALPTRNGRILISSGNSIAVCADHSCRQGVRCRMPDFYHPSICELQPLNVRSRTTRFFGLPCAPAGLRHRDGACPTAGGGEPVIYTSVRMLENFPRGVQNSARKCNARRVIPGG